MTIIGQKLTKGVTPTIWLTGLSGAGKSTLANALHETLTDLGYASSVLDGDALRAGINKDLGFSPQDRAENIRRVAEIARLMNKAGLIAIVALISPAQPDRAAAKRVIGENAFVEVYVSTPLAVCEQRDTKGLYKKVRAGQIHHFTGINAPYDIPSKPAVAIRADLMPVAESVASIIQYLGLLLPAQAPQPMLKG